MVYRNFACRRPINVIFCLTLISFTGCQATDLSFSNHQTNLPASNQDQFHLKSEVFNKQPHKNPSAFDHSVDILRDLGFELDRIDHRQGLITTLPKVVRPSFQWPGVDSMPPPEVSHTFGLTRVVHIQTDASHGSKANTQSPIHSPQVAVFLMRPQRPLIQPSMTASRGRMRSLSAVPTELEQQGVPATYSELIGRDVVAEAYLLEKLSQNQ